MKALALFSGGLDSILSVKLIADQGIEVIAVLLIRDSVERERRKSMNI